MTNKFDRIKLADNIVKAINKNKLSFPHYATEMLLEITAEQTALARLLAKKRLIHPKELNTETQKVKKRLVKNIKKMTKVMLKEK